ncbi:hypothetical protein FQN49_008814 [Arthroderma sp. PD_2]|nr:hypothetical protein FQN49_008814 [Arthroderma sp. PD_2]
MSFTLLGYLSEPNPVINNDNSPDGLPTFQSHMSTIDVRDWPDFTFETLMACYSHILGEEYDMQFPGISPPINILKCKIFNEDSLEHLLTRSIVPMVSVGLHRAWEQCYPDDLTGVIDMTRGGRARLQANTGDDSETKVYPDWAGVQSSEYSTGFVNRCPGDTKLSTKWTTRKPTVDSFKWPLAQMLKYCGDSWKTRYGYLITQKELVVLRFSREKIGSGVALKRSPRGTHPPPAQPSAQSARQRPRQRNDSIASYMSLDHSSPHSRQSSGSAPRSAGGESYIDNQLDIEYHPVEMKSIPWKNYGPGRLTVKLALWWIHMLAAAPGGDIYIDHDYPPLHSWVPINGHYRHTSTGLFSKKRPKSGSILGREASEGPSTPLRGQAGVTSPLSSPLSSPPMVTDTTPTLEEMESILWDDSNHRWWFEATDGRTGNFEYGTMIWSMRARNFGRAEFDEMGNFVFMIQDS